MMSAPNVSRWSTRLSFRLGGLPVRVDPWLLLMGAGIGLSFGHGVVAIAAALSLLVMVTVHELAHALTLRAFGVPTEVHATVFRDTLGPRIGKLPPMARAATAIAGPAASLILGGVAFAAARSLPPSAGAGVDAVRYLGFVNVAWGALNFVPILPLDMGYALEALLDRAAPGRGTEPARWISIAIAVALGLVAAHARMLIPTLVCGVLALQNARALQIRTDPNADALLRFQLRAAFAAVERGDAAVGIRHCQVVVAASRDRTLRRDAVRLLAYAYATTGDWRRLMALLESDGAAALADGELEKYQRAARELGHDEDACRLAAVIASSASGTRTSARRPA
jgi:Zn-dependent protease